MTYRNNVIRPAMTAIAAVLALSSTPSLAQDAAPAADAPPTPVVVPETVAEPTPPPEPVAAEIAPAAVEPAATVAEPAPQRTRIARTAPVRRAAAPARSAMERPAVAAPAPAAAAQTLPGEPAPIAAPAEAAVPPPIPIQQAAAAEAEAPSGNDMLPIAGIGAGVLALAGGAVALRRRRRHSDEVSYEPETFDTDHVAAVEPELPAVVPIAARSAPERTPMPTGFDVSHYGRHTQAAYRGPTPDNPSLSLKRRLKRAAFFDGRERMAGESAPATKLPPMSRAADDAVTTKVQQAVAQPEAPAFAPRRTARPASQPLFGFQQPSFQN